MNAAMTSATNRAIRKRRANARAALNNHSHNDFDGSLTAVDLAKHRYAVAVERDDDGWVIGANNVAEIAAIVKACYCYTDGYDEWVNAIIDLNTGEQPQWTETVRVTVSMSGYVATA